MKNWQKPYKHGLFVIWPPKKVSTAVNKLKSRYDPLSCSYIEAHVTLTQPFLKEPAPSVLKAIEKVIGEFPAFTINFGPIDVFENSTVIKYNIQPAKNILALREKLHQEGYFDLSLPFTEGFIPHMTISESGIKDKISARELAQKLNKENDGGSFICEEVAYVRPDDKFHFETMKKFQLK
jgi:2'-5' RNA ligase